MQDFSSFSDSPSAPARSIRPVAPDDEYDLPDGVCKSLFVVEDGDLEIIAQDDGNDQSVTIPVTAGWLVPIRVRRVMEATSAQVVALY